MKKISTLILRLALLTTINQATMNVDVHLWCDNHLTVIWSDDDFTTQITVAKTPDVSNPNSVVDTRNNNWQDFSFTAAKDATIRIGCWEYGGARYLRGDGTIKIDDVTYTVSDMINDGDLEYLGFEQTCETVCDVDVNACHADIPDTLNDFTLTNSLTTSDSLTPHDSGYWPAEDVDKCGIFWTEFVPYDMMKVDVNIQCDNFPAVFYSIDGFQTITTVYNPGEDASRNTNFAGSFTAEKGATIRIGCWDYGLPGRLIGTSTITVDGAESTITQILDAGDLKLVGFEGTCATYCDGGQTCRDEIPSTLSNVGSVTPSTGEIIDHPRHPNEYWVSSEIDKCGIFYSDFTPYPFNCPTVDADTFDWFTLTGDGTNKPEYQNFVIDVNASSLTLNIEIELPYIVESTDSNQDLQELGVTYVLDFEDFNAHHSSIAEPNTCSNRLQSDYNGLTDNERFEVKSERFDAIGTTNNMCYPPPGDTNTGWEIVQSESDCDTIKYKGQWTWGALRNCKNNANPTGSPNRDGVQTKIDDANSKYLELSGVFYVNVVSPFWNKDNDNYQNYYRVYQLISQPFVIQVSKSVYVIAGTGVNVMSMSIVAVYKEDAVSAIDNSLDNDYALILLTETAEYMMLENPTIIQFPSSDTQPDAHFTLELQSAAETGSTNDDCLNPKAFICSQMWKIFAVDTTCSVNRDIANPNGGIDFSGDYSIKFDPLCRTGTGANSYDYNGHCTTWITEHPDFDTNAGVNYKGVQLSSKLTFVDNICETKTFTIQLQASMTFYEEEENDPQFQTAISTANGNLDYLYQVGESFVYGEIALTFPDPAKLEQIFESELVNVWLCTFPPNFTPSDPSPDGPTDPANLDTNGGCFSDKRDGFSSAEDFFFHVYDSANNIAEHEFHAFSPNVEPNLIQYKFKLPNKIQRDLLYVHAQVSVTLQESMPRRRVLLDVSHGPIANKMSHFGKHIGITNKPYKKPEPELPPQQPNNYYPQQPNNYYPQQPPSEPFTISLNSTWMFIIGGLLAVILTFNIIFMCYMNCCKPTNGRARVSFNKNRRNGYDSVKHVDSEEFDDSEANLINVNQ